ncbi:hypothetical protein GCM10012285_06700 [Streptomyces kronopolitis]|uniref:Uncharacterized protein n=1 Tax=Streptomyces kronopolitis TaxID=1612435 RepID=A0ABQ2IY58_9ACTN|nr:hypothetical protein GCM10012285_06700 [Streptomyces kronopolitis]
MRAPLGDGTKCPGEGYIVPARDRVRPPPGSGRSDVVRGGLVRSTESDEEHSGGAEQRRDRAPRSPAREAADRLLAPFRPSFLGVRAHRAPPLHGSARGALRLRCTGRSPPLGADTPGHVRGGERGSTADTPASRENPPGAP